MSGTFTAAILAEALRRYGSSPERARPLAAADTMVYACDGLDGPFIMKLTHAQQRPRDYVQAELDWLAFLEQDGVPVAGPVRSQAGQLLELIPGRDGHWLARAYAVAPGRPVQASDWGPALYRAWGQLLGQLHSASRRYPEPFTVARRLHWHEVIQLYVQSAPAAEQPLLWSRAQPIAERLLRLPAVPATYGLVHAIFTWPIVISRTGV